MEQFVIDKNRRFESNTKIIAVYRHHHHHQQFKLHQARVRSNGWFLMTDAEPCYLPFNYHYWGDFEAIIIEVTLKLSLLRWPWSYHYWGDLETKFRKRRLCLRFGLRHYDLKIGDFLLLRLQVSKLFYCTNVNSFTET